VSEPEYSESHTEALVSNSKPICRCLDGNQIRIRKRSHFGKSSLNDPDTLCSHGRGGFQVYNSWVYKRKIDCCTTIRYCPVDSINDIGDGTSVRGCHRFHDAVVERRRRDSSSASGQQLCRSLNVLRRAFCPFSAYIASAIGLSRAQIMTS
jgi:hypothetical protein